MTWQLTLCVALTFGCTPADRSPAPADAVKAAFTRDLDLLGARLEWLERAALALKDRPAETRAVRAAFEEARTAYKRVEAFAEHFQPASAKELNGPALDRMEENDPNHVVTPPTGFQVIEELLYPEVQVALADTIANETRHARVLVRRIRSYATALEWTDAQVFDALRLQVARVATLGLASFDSPVALRGLTEGAAALRGVRDALAPYDADLARAASPLRDTPSQTLARAADALDRADFERGDRLGLLVDHLTPAAAALQQAQRALGIAAPSDARPLRPAAVTPYARGAFDVAAFAPGAPAPGSQAVALGQRLFTEPALSGRGDRSCASCHDPGRAFTDGQPRSVPLVRAALLRNAPTLVNSALQAAMFYDLRAASLEQQIANVVANPAEMRGSLDTAAARLGRDPTYAAAFRTAFAGASAAGDAPVTAGRITAALAAYLRSLSALDARFDRAARGDTAALTAEERRGFTVFMAKGKCGTCHFAPLFSGVVPPTFRESEAEVLGVPERPAVRAARVDPDEGRYRTTRLPIHRFAFKTPTVRNAALTAPYMHNGVYRTLEEVVDFYDRGGGAGIGIDLPNQTLPPDSLRLTPEDRRALVAFLGALTDTATARGP